MPPANPSEACEIFSQSLSNIDWFKKTYLKCFYRRLSDCRNYIFEYYFNLIIFQFTPASFFQRWKQWLFYFYDFEKKPKITLKSPKIPVQITLKIYQGRRTLKNNEHLNCRTFEYANISEHANFWIFQNTNISENSIFRTFEQWRTLEIWTFDWSIIKEPTNVRTLELWKSWI